jgi:serine/threonine-protein kinase
MSPSSWDRVNALLDAALTRPLPERAAFLRSACGDDETLRREVESLLQAHDQADDFLSTPAHELIAPMPEQASSSQDALVGQEIDGYRILDVLGRGGMGVVYKVKNLSLDRVEALKVIAPFLVRDDQFLRRFQIEARALARIHHPNIVTVHTLRESELGHYLTMEYVDGQTLGDLIEARGALPWHEVLPLFTQLLEAFEYAHDRGIIHRDIKPRNIMLTADDTVKVMDFGLAKFYLNQDVTQTAGVSGTLCYMSPEQIRGAKLDQRSDLFSLGLTLYELVSGQLPFDRHDSQFSIQRAIVEESFEPPHRRHTAVPERLSEIVMRTLEKDPDQRYQRARDMLEDLKTFADDTVDQRDWPTVTNLDARRDAATRRLPLRWKRTLAGAALVIVLAGGGYAMGPTLWAALSGETPPPTEPATSSASPLAAAEATPATADDSAPSRDATTEPNPPAGNATDDPDETPSPATPSLAPTTTEADPGRRDPAETSSQPAEPDAAQQESQLSSEEDAPGPDDGATDLPVQAQETPPDPAEPIEAEASESATEPPPEEEAVTEDALPPTEQAVQEARTLRSRLETALLDDAWTTLPEPLVAFYREKRRDLSRKFRVLDADVLIDERGLTTRAQQVEVPVTVYIQFQQRGRDGTESVPIPATWTWTTADASPRLVQVQ